MIGKLTDIRFEDNFVISNSLDFGEGVEASVFIKIYVTDCNQEKENVQHCSSVRVVELLTVYLYC